VRLYYKFHNLKKSSIVHANISINDVAPDQVCDAVSMTPLRCEYYEAPAELRYLGRAKERRQEGPRGD
jgi:hypothetical protein